MESILFETVQNIGLITLNRVDALNALTLEMIVTLRAQLLTWKTDPTILAVVLCSASSKAFCAGGDVRALYHLREEGYATQMQFFQEEYALNQLIHDYEKPYIVLMNGLTMGGGIGIALHGQYAIAGMHCQFAMPETRIGFFPDVGASFLLSRCGAWGRYYGVTGHTFNTAEALALKLVYGGTDVEMDVILQALLQADWSLAPHTVVQRCLATFMTVKPAVLQPMELFNAPTIDKIFDALDAEKTTWAESTRATLAVCAPLSLAVTLEQLTRAKGQSLAACLAMDYTLASHFVRDVDFYEGVRALLVDKDKNPHWQIATAEKVAAYFLG